MKHAVEPAGRIRRWLLPIVAVVLVAAVGVTAWVFNRAQSAVDHVNTSGEGGSAVDVLVPKPLHREESGRVNILLTGNSFDDEGHDGATLTDSIMVASMDLATKRTTLVSIPRDLYVKYAGQWMKINAVYPKASRSSSDTPGLGDSGAGLAAMSQVVTEITGLTIDHRVLVGYTALKDAVNAVGGIDVVIDSTDPRGIWDPSSDNLRLANGLQHLDGATALKLVRARNHKRSERDQPYGINMDWDREKYQRKVLSALLKKVQSTPSLANPATMVAIFDSLSANVRTDLTVSQVRRIYDLTDAAPEPKSVAIKSLLRDYRPKGTSALLPKAGMGDYSQIRRFVASSLA